MNKYIEIRTGSDSDIPKINSLYTFLDDLNISYSRRILSAHRTPHEMIQEAEKLEKQHFRVSIAAAGGSAHLAGMTASETSIPIIALPVKSSLGGIDALLSMIQMPPGVPNGCVGINDSIGAAILALRIAYLDNSEIRNSLATKLGTKVNVNLGNLPKVEIITDLDTLDTSLLDILKITYSINSKQISSPIVIYINDISKFPKCISTKDEQISIIAPLKNDSFNLIDLEYLVLGPYAWVGIDRINNSYLFAAQILGIYFEEVRNKLKEYKSKLYQEVLHKDLKIQQK